MANLNIVETPGAAAEVNGAQVIRVPPIATQNVALSSTSTQSAAFNPSTRVVRLQSDMDCFIEFGPSPTALTISMPLVARQPEYFAVGVGHKVAARIA